MVCMKITMIEHRSRFLNLPPLGETRYYLDYSLLDEKACETYKQEGESNGVANLRLNESEFVFIDGVLEELPITVRYEDGGNELSSNVYIINVGCGFENCEMLSKKIKILFPVPEYLPENKKDKIKEILEEKTRRTVRFIPVRPVFEKTLGETTEDVLEILRDEEQSFVEDVISKLQKEIVILDGNLSERIASYKIDNLMVGVVKNFSWPNDFISKIDEYLVGTRTRLICAELRGRERYSFFLKLQQDELIRIDFFYPGGTKCDVIEFADFIAGKVKNWAQNIGDRAPNNITPIRILEKRLRSIIGDTKLNVRSIKEALSHIEKVVST